jgi:hypothetical protein
MKSSSSSSSSSSPSSSPSSIINAIDQLTLELLTSRKQYNQYLKQTDTKKYLEQTEFLIKIKRHKPKLMEVIQKLLDDPTHPFSNEINDTFIPFVRAIFKYNESVQSMQETDYAEDQDMLFDNCVETEEDSRESFDGPGAGPGAGSYSENLIQYSMQMFMNPNRKLVKNKFMERQKQERFANKNNGNENNIASDYNEYYDSEEQEEDVDEET